MKYPSEIVAREKLVKSLYITGDRDSAEQEANDLLSMNEGDEIGLWYMAKINRKRDDPYIEKQYLEKLIEVSPPMSQIKAQKRLDTLNFILDEREKKEELERIKQESYTEEARQKFIENIQNEFLEGILRLEDLEHNIEKAKRYPNFVQSLISLSDIKVLMTENLEEKISTLEEYANTAKTLTPKEYNDILEDVSNTRKKILQRKEEEQYVNEIYNSDNYIEQVQAKLEQGKLTKDELPMIVKKLEKVSNRIEAILFIAKLNDLFYGKEEATKILDRYSQIQDLTDEEKNKIAEQKDYYKNFIKPKNNQTYTEEDRNEPSEL